MNYDDDCITDHQDYPMCEYQGKYKNGFNWSYVLRPIFCAGCFTLEGKQCIFPFQYFNVSDDGTRTDLTYTKCTTLDIYRPWCPTGQRKFGASDRSFIGPFVLIFTEVNANDEILSWGECIESCPQEVPETVCLDEPLFPPYSFFGEPYVNFTADYVQGSGEETKDVSLHFLCEIVVAEQSARPPDGCTGTGETSDPETNPSPAPPPCMGPDSSLCRTPMQASHLWCGGHMSEDKVCSHIY